MPLNGSGTYNPPGASFPAVVGQIIESNKYNSVVNDIAAALSQAFYRDGQAPMTGTLNAGNQLVSNVGGVRNALGSVGNPSYAFTGDLSTGVYSPAVGQLAMAVNGALRALIDSTKSRIQSPDGTKYVDVANNGVSIVGNPAFFAYRLSGNQTSGSVLTFDTEVLDTGSAFNPATGVFTAPVAGLYMFGASIKMFLSSPGTEALFWASDSVGAVLTPGFSIYARNNQSAGAVAPVMVGTGLRSMAQGDTLRMWAVSVPPTALNPVEAGYATYFYGVKIS
jgi:hypothetical protein